MNYWFVSKRKIQKVKNHNQNLKFFLLKTNNRQTFGLVFFLSFIFFPDSSCRDKSIIKKIEAKLTKTILFWNKVNKNNPKGLLGHEMFLPI